MLKYLNHRDATLLLNLQLMNIKALEEYFVEQATALYDTEEARSLFYMITAQLQGWGRGYILINGTKEVDANQLDKYEEILLELKTGKPLQYIFEETIFYGLKFNVSPAVLIPRPETEELVDWILQTVGVKQQKPTNILDIGTGSGCIAISLKKHLNTNNVSALEVSADALIVAEKNAVLNNVIINFINQDILTYSGDENYDLIVSNPPYIKEDERADMHQNVLDHEPHLALFVATERPLLFYEAIADFAIKHLRQEGNLFFEINEYLGKETITMLENKGFNKIILKKDMQGKDRMICCSL